MGLDMYLYAFDPEDRETIKKSIIHVFDGYYQEDAHNTEEYKEIYYKLEELVYWRKANAIHNFFCTRGEKIERDTYYFIPRKVIEDLIKECAKVLILRDSEFSNECLPTSDGFFFGSTDYDDWYYDRVKSTMDKLKLVLKTHSDDEFLYYASW